MSLIRIILLLPVIILLLLITILPFRMLYHARDGERIKESLGHLLDCFSKVSTKLIGMLDDGLLISEICSCNLRARQVGDHEQFITLLGIFSRLDDTARLYFGTGCFRDESDPTQFVEEPLFWLQYKYRGRYYVSHYRNDALFTYARYDFIATVRGEVISACKYSDIADTVFRYYAPLS